VIRVVFEKNFKRVSFRNADGSGEIELGLVVLQNNYCAI
jgi:hypothetical protein